MAGIRIIKKYPNRRLYDTELSRYVTLSDVRKLVMDETSFKVVDANSEEDLTRSILLQIILEQEAGSEPLLSTESMEHMIRVYGDTVRGVFSGYLEKSLSLFSEQQEQMREILKGAESANPLNFMTDMTQRNLKLWQEMQKSFLGAVAKPGKPAKKTPKAD